MKTETAKKIRACKVIKDNTYKTDRGIYRIRILRHRNGDLYFHKTKDGELCELVNLSRKAVPDEG